MLPAAEGKIEETRFFMDRAEDCADRANAQADASSISLRDAKKTVLESKLKEMLYVAMKRCVVSTKPARNCGL